MKLAATIARYLLGLMFSVFGLNGFYPFIPTPPPASPVAVEYMTVMTTSHYFAVIFAFELVAGLLLLSNRFVALALTLLGALLVNILLFHILMDPTGIAPGLIATVLWALLFARHRSAFSGILQAGA